MVKKKSNDVKKNEDPVVKRLDGMLNLMIEQLHENNMELGRIYNTLYKTGFTPTEIGKIVGKTRTTVNGMISQYNRGRDKDER